MKMSVVRLFLFLWIAQLSLWTSVVAEQVAVDENGNLMEGKGDDFLTVKLMKLAEEVEAKMPLEEAMEISEMMKVARSDPDTQVMMQKIKVEQKDNLAELVKSSTSKEILKELRGIWSEIKMLEVLFKDPKRAVELMNEDGMVPKDRLGKYRRNPELLEEDTRRSLYLSFITLSLAGGFL